LSKTTVRNSSIFFSFKDIVYKIDIQLFLTPRDVKNRRGDILEMNQEAQEISARKEAAQTAVSRNALHW
jgi:hypothetical protein